MVANLLRCPYVDPVQPQLPEGHALPDTEHYFPDPADGPWLLTLNWRVTDGRPECSGIALRPTAGAPVDLVLTASTLKALRIAEKIAADRRRVLPPVVPTTVGLRRSTVERLQTAANVYQAARGRNEPPTKAVAEHFGITQGGASNLVARARAVGLLPPTSPGVPTA